MKSFNGILEDGTTVEITHNDKNTHFYINGKRVKATLAIEAKERYEVSLIAKKSEETQKATRKEKEQIVVPTNLDAEEVIAMVQSEKSINVKKAIIANNITSELVFLLNLNKKSSKGKGININRYNKFIYECETSKNKDIIEAYKQVNRSKEFRPAYASFITSLNGENGNTVRFEISTVEKFAVMSAIPIGKEELYLSAISKNLKLGLSDKIIEELL